MYPPAAACQRISPVVQRISPVVLHTLRNHGENLGESFVMPLFVRSTVWSSVHVLNMKTLQLQMHINPVLLDSVAVTPLLRPVPKTHCEGGKTK